MLKHYVAKPFMFIFLGGISFLLCSANTRSDSGSNEKTKPGISAESSISNSQQSNNQTSNEAERIDQAQWKNQREIAYRDDDTPLQKRSYRMSNWDYKSNWRYYREAFYRGETQPQAYRKGRSPGSAGIGYDGDPNYRKLRALMDKNQQESTRYASQNNQANQNRTNGNAYSNSQQSYSSAASPNYAGNANPGRLNGNGASQPQQPYSSATRPNYAGNANQNGYSYANGYNYSYYPSYSDHYQGQYYSSYNSNDANPYSYYQDSDDNRLIGDNFSDGYTPYSSTPEYQWDYLNQ
jgi:hypothetical protein